MDIVAVIEMHLSYNDQLDFTDYLWFGKNRHSQHVNAGVGSGGVGFMINRALLSDFDIHVIDDTVDDMIWIKVQSKIIVSLCFCLCACYLPPVNSSRPVCADSFFEDLLEKVYLYQGQGTVIISGDFNSRLGNYVDYIEGVDDLPPRTVLDHTCNGYGSLFADFLVRSNLCVFNGRSGLDDFTCVSPRGASVVDYCVIPQESIAQPWNFIVKRAR